MTSKTTQAPQAAQTAQVAQDTPPWEQALELMPRDPAGNEAVSVAWTQVALPFVVFPDDPASDEEPTTAHALWSVTLRGINPDDLIDQLIQFSGLVAASGGKFVSEKDYKPFVVQPKFVPQPVASSPLPQAQPPQQTAKQWSPQGQQWQPPQGRQQAAPAQQHVQGSEDNTFIAESLLVANKNKLDGETYIEYRLKGPRYPTFGVRVYPDKLNEVLPGWGDAPVGLHQLPTRYKCTFSWDTKLGKDGTPQPKNVYAMEAVQ